LVLLSSVLVGFTKLVTFASAFLFAVPELTASETVATEFDAAELCTVALGAAKFDAELCAVALGAVELDAELFSVALDTVALSETELVASELTAVFVAGSALELTSASELVPLTAETSSLLSALLFTEAALVTGGVFSSA